MLPKLQVIMPMAGNGERFKKEGFNVSKPLIKIGNLPMFQWALKSLEGFNLSMKVILIVKEFDSIDFRESLIDTYWENKVEIFCAPSSTRGAAETVSLVENLVDSSSSLLIMDCDMYFKGREFQEFVENKLEQDSALITFSSDKDFYSYITKSDGYAVDIAEKRKISNIAVAGAYFWRSAGDFFLHASHFLSEDTIDYANEKYLSGVVKKSISKNLRFRIFQTEFHSFGTPDELDSFKKSPLFNEMLKSG